MIIVRATCLILALLFTTIPARAAEFVVVESSSLALALGTVISGSISLSSGESVTLMDGMGTLYRQTGPFEGSFVAAEGKSGANTIRVLSGLLADNATDTTTLGAIRNVNGQVAGDLNLLSGETAGDQCVASSPHLGIWRASGDGQETASLRLVGGKGADVSWGKGETVASWPGAVPVESGGIYLLRRSGASIPYKIDLQVIPNVSDPIAGIALMAEAGCTLQANEALSAFIQAGTE